MGIPIKNSSNNRLTVRPTASPLLDPEKKTCILTHHELTKHGKSDGTQKQHVSIMLTEYIYRRRSMFVAVYKLYICMSSM